MKQTSQDVSQNTNTAYINSTDYETLSTKIKTLKSILEDNIAKSLSSRKLRYAEIDIEIQRKAGKIQPDELYIPQHIIDTNIRREQSPYVQYITQSPRAVILKDKIDPSFDLSLLETDLTAKLRFDGWQLGMYANIDGFQANGYGIMETTLDQSNQGELGREYVSLGDFAFISDTRDLQAVEMSARAYYFTRTKLLALCNQKNPSDNWEKVQVDKVINMEPTSDTLEPSYSTNADKSLYKIQKIMFRVSGIVQVAWSCYEVADDWLRKPRPLFLGRKKINQQAAKSAPFVGKMPSTILKGLATGLKDNHIAQIKAGLPPSDDQFETAYPYFLYPYLISENDTIANLKGRIFLDQDTQTAVTSLTSSTVTQARRASGLYFAKKTADPNDDFLMQKNTNFRTGCLVNGNIEVFQLPAPDSSMFSAIQLLVSQNQNENSQVNFAVNNRKDSRKTATEISTATQQASQLSTVQVTLFSIALKQQFTYECEIIKSRVLAGLIKVSPQVHQLYARSWTVKPSGDTDVIEKQQLIQAMMAAWPIMQNTPAAPLFLSDLLEKMFPETAAKYLQAFSQAQAQQQSQQAQQQQQGQQMLLQMGKGIVDLSKHPEFFSDAGKLHALPQLEQSAQQLEEMEQQVAQQAKGQAQ